MSQIDLTSFEKRAVPLGILGLRISQNGAARTHRVWDDECRRNVYSASKSFTAFAVGIAIREGLLDLNEKLTDAFSDDLPDHVSDHLAAATVRDLLTMCLGQAEAGLMGGQRPLYETDDWVKLSLALPFVDCPGTRFVYNNVGPYLAGVLVQRRCGCDLVSYLTPRLFAPLGIRRPMWETDPRGYTFGAGGLFLTLSELHRFGLLCLQKGSWNGRQLVPAHWVEECSRPQDDAGYGYLFWIGEQNSYRADGKYCQLSIVLPDKNTVITTVAECRKPKAFRAAIFEELYPQL